ncbi:MAG: ATP-binding cassette domain-containing protein [Bacteroidales bacterium]|nr:ATP-binding cassette domain-containing protein [Bacteroidales bacterium]
MSNIAISFEHVSKMYQLGVVGTGSLSNDIKRWWYTSVLNKEDPFLRIGQTNDRAAKAQSDFVFALRDITFDVEQGDVIGLIGKNGAGKSTLLKLLSRITAPTAGTIKAKGRIASLLEVGTGFVSELTGRENIYMNGSIMGMTKQEIDRKLDEIIDFSGCEMYIDTPVKRYSSGMQVRLGFAVAAFLEPEILVVDEVLAVGDAEFQKKAIGKMQDVAYSGGRTVLFVSHNMESVRKLCKHGVVLKNGMVEMTGTADECVDFYMDTNIEKFERHVVLSDKKHRNAVLLKELEIVEATLENDDVENMSTDEPIRIALHVKINNPRIKKFTIGSHVINSADVAVVTTISPVMDCSAYTDTFDIRMVISNHNLVAGSYKLYFNIGIKDVTLGVRDFDVVKNVLAFRVSYKNQDGHIPYVAWQKGWGSHCVESVDYQFV